MESKDTKKRALHGSAWTLFGYGLGQAIRLGTNLVLAHLLFPAAFGVMALVSVVMLGMASFSDIGVGPSIIQNKRGEDPDFLNTAWTIQVIRGFCLWIAACLLAWPVAWFFGKTDPLSHQLLWILPVVGFSSAFYGFNPTIGFVLNRRLQFGRLTILDLLSQIAGSATMIISAWIHPSVWALVEGWIVSLLVHMLLCYWLSLPFVNRFRWDALALSDLTNFGTWIFLGTIVTFFAGNLDRILLGRLLTLKELGLYSIALSFARLTLEITNRVSSNVLFPVLSRSQDDQVTLVGQSIRARGLILLAGGSMVCAFAIMAPPFFNHLYDPRYAAAGAISQWLSIMIWFNIVLSSMERVPLALGHSRALFISNLVTTAGYGIAIFGYWRAGLPGFILGLSSGYIMAHLILLLWIPIRRRDMLTQSALYTVCFGLYGLASLFWIRWLSIHLTLNWEIAASLVSALIPCIVAGIFILFNLRKIMKA